MYNDDNTNKKREREKKRLKQKCSKCELSIFRRCSERLERDVFVRGAAKAGPRPVLTAFSPTPRDVPPRGWGSPPAATPFPTRRSENAFYILLARFSQQRRRFGNAFAL